MIDWQHIDTVLLDMDGTLLDLNFDNHFWLELIPAYYAKKNKLSIEQTMQLLVPQFKAMEGQLEWYCLDYWSDKLQLDIIGLKKEIADKINILPHVVEFLTAVQQSNRSILLVTNAHRDSLDLKMERTCLAPFFNQIISSHDYGAPKESTLFWQQLEQQHIFDKQKTLLVDDSLSVLKAAQQYGIKHLISISKPDSQRAVKVVEGFSAIEDFRSLMIGLYASTN